MQIRAFLSLLALLITLPTSAAPNHKLRTEFPQTNGYVSSIALDEAREVVYIAGSFTQVGGQSRTNLAAINTRTGTLLPWNPGANAFVRKIVLDGDTLYIGGTFTQCGGLTRNRLAAVDLDGNVLPWNPDANNYVLDMVVTPDKVYVSGGFLHIGGFNRTRLAALDKATAAVLSWAPSANANPQSLLLFGSSIYIGGEFSQLNATARNQIGAVSTSGALLPWNPGANDSVEKIIDLGTSLLVQGRFDQIGGAARDGLARIDHDGNVLPWAPELNGIPAAAGLHGNRVYVCGFFTQSGGAARSGLAAFDLSGNLLPWNPSLAGDVLYEVVASSEGTVYVGGVIDTIDGIPSKGFAAIYDAGLLPVPSVTIRGKKRSETTRGTITIKGRSTGATRVEVKSSSTTFRAAKGVQSWRKRVRLKPGRNVISARSLNQADVISKRVRQIIFRH